MTLPYVGNASSVYKNVSITQFKKINYYCNVNFRTFKVSNLFLLKDVPPLTHMVIVDYCHKESCDKNKFYIGKAKDI